MEPLFTQESASFRKTSVDAQGWRERHFRSRTEPVTTCEPQEPRPPSMDYISQGCLASATMQNPMVDLKVLPNRFVIVPCIATRYAEANDNRLPSQGARNPVPHRVHPWGASCARTQARPPSGGARCRHITGGIKPAGLPAPSPQRSAERPLVHVGKWQLARHVPVCRHRRGSGRVSGLALKEDAIVMKNPPIPASCCAKMCCGRSVSK